MIKNWEKFQQKRKIPESDKIVSCYAAFNHFRMHLDGEMGPCCFADERQEWSKDVSLKDYWFDGLNADYQSRFLSEDLHSGCRTCKNRIENDVTPPIVEYDENVTEGRLEHALSENYPKIFEFVISNLCNLACEMCHVGLSSKLFERDKHLIEKFPEVYGKKSIFDDEETMNLMIEQFKEFIPHLEEIRFVGGEPFAHKGMFKIAKVIADINPDCSLQVCTNGTVYNKKVEEICKNNNLRLTISVDSVIEEEYKQIRIGAKYKTTYENVQKFKEILGSDKITVNATFMSINAKNINKLFTYAVENDFKTFINAYIREWREHTKDWSISTMSNDDRKTSIGRLTALLGDEDYKNHHREIKKVIDLL